MDLPVALSTPAAVAPPAWRRIALPVSIGLLCLAVTFPQEIAAAIRTWTASTAYNHCFLVIPIVLFLLWDRRADLATLTARPEPRLALGAVPVALVWLTSERLGIMEGRQLAALTFVQVLFLALLGRRLWRGASGPLLYLYFLVPFGEFLTPRLQDITTFFIGHGLDLLGVPAYIDGYVIEIPQGTFFVAEACAGLRFLVASLAFGCLYALMMYRSPGRRALFIVVSVIVPIIANGIRGTGIVYLGYLLGSAQAAAADHIIYGWLFFSFVILVLIAVGLPFRQDGMHAPPRQENPGRPVSLRRAVAVALAVALIGAACPILTTGLALSSPLPVSGLASIDPGPGCTIIPDEATRTGGAHIVSERVICDTVAMDVRWETFSPRTTAGPVMAEQRRLTRAAATESLSEAWLQDRDSTPTAWRIMRSNDPYYVLGTCIWVDGKAVRPGLSMRAHLALDSLFGAGHAPVLMTVTPALRFQNLNPAEYQMAEETLRAFLQDHPDLYPRPDGLANLRY